MDDQALLLVTTLVGVVTLGVWKRLRPVAETPGAAMDGAAMDGVIAALIGVVSWIVLRCTHAAYNPDWIPYGQDNHDYLACIVALRFDHPELWSPARYPLYPALVAIADVVTGRPLWRVAMEVSLATSALVPVSVYLFGRVYAARPIALAGALLTLHLPSHLFMLGSPTDYPLAAALYAASFGTLVLAVRDGGVPRHALGGVVLALYFLATPKAFPMLLCGIGGVAFGQVADRRLDLRALTAFLAPLCLAWATFAALDLHLFPLEHDLVGVQQWDDWLDPSLPFPDVGWHLNDPTEHGYWVPGTTAALVHLPDVLTYLLHAPIHAMTLQERLDVFLPRLSAELSVAPALVLLSVCGTLGAWRAGQTWARNLTAVVFAALLATTHLWGLTTAPYADRYALPLLCTTPVLLLAFVAWPIRGAHGPRVALVFLPLAAAVAWVLGPSPGALGQERLTATMEPWAMARPPLSGLARFRDRLEPGDEVVDATATGLLTALLDGEPVTLTRGHVLVTPEATTLDFPASSAPHRYVVLGCVNEGELPPEHSNEILRRRLIADTARFVGIDRCTFRDLRPELAYGG